MSLLSNKFVIILIIFLGYYFFVKDKGKPGLFSDHEPLTSEVNPKKTDIKKKVKKKGKKVVKSKKEGKKVVKSKLEKSINQSLVNNDKSTKMVFLDIKDIGRINILLYDNVPRTSLNFLELARGVEINNNDYQYKGSSFHRIIKNFMIQGGDITNNDGTGGISIYGNKFDDEITGLQNKHDKPFLLSMANAGPNTNSSQFFITTVPTPHLDGKHVVFGEVADDDSKKVVKKIESLKTNELDAPLNPVIITNSGEYKSL